jgi:hypothetical protein
MSSDDRPRRSTPSRAAIASAARSEDRMIVT